jgi:uridine kinase
VISAREKLLRLVASEIEALLDRSIVRVGIDGVDGAGKTWFANELAECIEGAPVIRASVDSFHNPRAVRYARGKDSPEGFFEDSFNYALLKEVLLNPLGPRGSRQFRRDAFDHTTDEPVDAHVEIAPIPSVLLFDGIFVHRPELRDYWDYSVFLHVSTEESVRRCNTRTGTLDAPVDPEDPIHRRYVRGQEIYLLRCEPTSFATRVIINEELESPRISE